MQADDFSNQPGHRKQAITTEFLKPDEFCNTKKYLPRLALNHY